jgi:hypothetical protein
MSEISLARKHENRNSKSMPFDRISTSDLFDGHSFHRVDASLELGSTLTRQIWVLHEICITTDWQLSYAYFNFTNKNANETRFGWHEMWHIRRFYESCYSIHRRSSGIFDVIWKTSKNIGSVRCFVKHNERNTNESRIIPVDSMHSIGYVSRDRCVLFYICFWIHRIECQSTYCWRCLTDKIDTRTNNEKVIHRIHVACHQMVNSAMTSIWWFV